MFKAADSTYFNRDENIIISSSTLLSACFNENQELIKYLITISRVNTEKLVSMGQFEDHDNITYYTAYHGKDEYRYKALFNMTAPVLWHACRTFSISVIRQLVELGACVNSKSETRLNSTPLMVACAKNRFEVVKFLIEKGKADINATDKNGDTCLVYALRHNENCLKLVQYLITKNINLANVNLSNRTALDYAVNITTCEPLDFILKEIMRQKITNICYDIALITSAINCDCEKLKSLYIHDLSNNKPVKIDALEAIGVTLGDDRELLESALMYWDASLDERKKSSVTKVTVRTNEGFFKEFSSKSELNPLAQEPIEFQMQSIWIRDTILKKYKFANRLADYNLCKMLFIKKSQLVLRNANNVKYRYLTSNFNRLVTLWVRTLELQITYLSPLHDSTIENLYDFINYLKYVSNESLVKNTQMYSNLWLRLLKICLYELNRTTKEVKGSKFDKDLPIILNNKLQYMLGSTFNKVDFKCLFENIELDRVEKYPVFESINYHESEKLNRNMDRVYRLIIYLNEFAFTNPSTLQLNNEFKDIMKKLISANTKFVKNGSLKFLSMACRPKKINSDMLIDNKFLNDDTSLNFKLVQHLLESGCDANSLIDVNSMNNTFLNEGLFRFEATGLKTKFEFDSIIELFLKHGAHLDFTNDNSLTLMELYHSKFDKSMCNFIKTANFISLKCLAAKRIVESGVYYHSNQLPTELVAFVKKHQ